jgi:cyclic pyranopterin monophosphate synthase
LADKLTHIADNGAPRMVDVSGKSVSPRSASAIAWVRFEASVFDQLKSAGFNSKKGAIFHTAIIAGVQAAKRTHELIPFCHAIALDGCDVEIDALEAEHSVRIQTTAKCTGKTGVEMEALTAASVAALTVYDMTKALSLSTHIEGPKLLGKRGGKRDFAALES